MPTYDYICRKCKKKFTLIMTISAFEKKKVRCPKCQSRQVEQEWGSFFIVTSKKS